MKHSKSLLEQTALVLVIAAALVTGSCKKSEYHQLSDDDMSWLVYDNNEVDVFTNSNNESVSYYVTLRTKAYHEDGSHYNEFTAANFLLLNDTSAFTQADSKGELYIYKQDDESLLVTLSWPHFPLRQVSITNQSYITETFNGIIYSDIIVIDASALCDARNYIGTIWYSKSDGVMQYEDVSGETWVKEI